MRGVWCEMKGEKKRCESVIRCVYEDRNVAKSNP